MSSIVNLAAYKFARLDELKQRRQWLRPFCRQLGLKGTILLSPEGINMFVAGSRAAVDALIAKLKEEPALQDLQGKESLSDRQPFRRMLVKIKREIISFDVDGIDPIERTSPKLSPEELKRWLDEGRPVTLLDVRNDYEVQLGTFENALPIAIDNFRDFPAAVKKLPPETRDQPIVMFCTGGIRCEKAGPLMQREGFDNVFQLDGGILKYFEDCGGQHYDGECFVFDQRVAVDSTLCETETTQCFACQAPLSLEDQQSPYYVVGSSCANCFIPPTERIQKTVQQRGEQIRKLTQVLPGSAPYENRRPLNVPGRCDRLTLLEVLTELHPHVGEAEWLARCRAGRLQRVQKRNLQADIERETLSPDAVVRGGERIEHIIPETVEPNVNFDVEVLYEDASLVVVNKSAPLPMHPSGRFNRNTLISVLNQVYHPQRLRMTHRLDANTTGVVVFAKTRPVAAKIQPQFESGNIQKTYLACVTGHPPEDKFDCKVPISVTTTDAGARTADENGLAAETLFRVIERRNNGTALLEVKPITGRTNQIRLHLAHLNLPICGDATYLGHQQNGTQQTLDIADHPLCLHAWRIELAHPATGKRVTFEASPPAWTNDLL